MASCSKKNTKIDIKQIKIFESIKSSFDNLPRQQRRKFTVVYGTKNGDNMAVKFGICKISWDIDSDWEIEALSLPTKSDLIDVLGSGKIAVNKWYDKWKRSDIKGTSRSVFSAFCDALMSGDDPQSGGAPQLVGIYRTGHSKGRIPHFRVTHKLLEQTYLPYFSTYSISLLSNSNVT